MKTYIQFLKQWWEDYVMRWIAPECLYLSELHGLICLLYWSEAATYYLNYEREKYWIWLRLKQSVIYETEAQIWDVVGTEILNDTSL